MRAMHSHVLQVERGLMEGLTCAACGAWHAWREEAGEQQAESLRVGCDIALCHGRMAALACVGLADDAMRHASCGWPLAESWCRQVGARGNRRRGLIVEWPAPRVQRKSVAPDHSPWRVWESSHAAKMLHGRSNGRTMRTIDSTDHGSGSWVHPGRAVRNSGVSKLTVSNQVQRKDPPVDHIPVHSAESG